MSAPQLRTVAGIQYQGQHRDVKNLILRVREDGTVTLSVPRRVSWKQADLYVELKAEWIAQAQQRQEQRAQRRCLPLLSQEQALAHFWELSSKVYPAFADVLGGVPPEIRVRDMTSCWGTCCPGKRRITFARKLCQMPPAAQIYVVVHEYCHFIQLNHSPAFWAEVEKLLPDWKARRTLLK